MKWKIFGLLCAVCAVFVVGGCKVQDEIKIENNTLVVNLSANATTGYNWTYVIDNPQLLECVEEKYVPYPSNNMVGVGGTYTAKFLPKLDGETSIIFNYQRNWEPAPIQTKTINLKIENGQILIIN